jgi:hypothetical protein
MKIRVVRAKDGAKACATDAPCPREGRRRAFRANEWRVWDGQLYQEEKWIKPA